MTDTLTRWLPLFEKDESLRPKDVNGHILVYESVRLRDLKRWWWATKRSDMATFDPCRDPSIPIRDAAVRWLRERGTLSLTPGGTEFSLCEPKVGLHSVSLDDRDDELYEIARDAVEAVQSCDSATPA